MKQTKLVLTILAICLSLRLWSAPQPITVTWTGAVSTDWNNASNWSPASVPSGSTNAVIPNTTNKPRIGSAGGFVQNITFATGAGLTIDAGSFLSVNGHWIAPAALITVAGEGEVDLSGTGTGTVYDSIIGYSSFYKLYIYDNYTVPTASANNKIEVRGRLGLNGGDIMTSDKVTLKSSATATAFITSDGGSITGKITMERYVSGASGFHHLSSAVTDATVGGWAASFPISGANGVQSSRTVGPTLEEYREPSNSYNVLDSGYYNYTSASNPLTPGKGLTAIITSPRVVKTFGTPNLSFVSYPLTKTAGGGSHGWNFVGNPFPAPISWSATQGDFSTSNVSATAYLWKATTSRSGSWVAYDGIVRDTIASSQGFFVYCTAASGTLGLSFFNTVSAFTPKYYKTSEKRNEVILHIDGSETGVSDISTYTARGASDDEDPAYDGMMPPIMDGVDNPTISFAIKGEHYFSHVTDAISSTTEMPLDMHLVKAGTYTISAAAIKAMDYPVYILDRVSGTYYDLSKEALTISTQGHEDINGRYVLTFGKSSSATTHTLIYSTSGAVVIERAAGETGEAQVTITNMLGQQVVNTTMTGNSIQLPLSHSDNIYLVSVRSNGVETISKIQVK